MEVQILQYIDDDHQSHYWYSGDCAEITYKDYKAYISARGIIDIDYEKDGVIMESFKDKGNNGSFYEYMKHHLKNDEELYKNLQNGSIIVMDNNWWECFIIDKKGVFRDIGWVLDSDYLKEAIEEAKEGIASFIDAMEKQNLYQYIKRQV